MIDFFFSEYDISEWKKQKQKQNKTKRKTNQKQKFVSPYFLMFRPHSTKNAVLRYTPPFSTGAVSQCVQIKR